MDEKKNQNLNAEAAGELVDEALDQVAGGLSRYRFEHINKGEKSWRCPHCNWEFWFTPAEYDEKARSHEASCKEIQDMKAKWQHKHI